MSTRRVLFNGVWKAFRRGQRHDSLRDLLPSLVRRAFGRSRQVDDNVFWALKGIAFTYGPAGGASPAAFQSAVSAWNVRG